MRTKKKTHCFLHHSQEMFLHSLKQNKYILLSLKQNNLFLLVVKEETSIVPAPYLYSFLVKGPPTCSSEEVIWWEVGQRPALTWMSRSEQGFVFDGGFGRRSASSVFRRAQLRNIV